MPDIRQMIISHLLCDPVLGYPGEVESGTQRSVLSLDLDSQRHIRGKNPIIYPL